MAERPILFSAPMVRAILAGTKTQTRRVLRRQFAADAVPAEMAKTAPEGWVVAGHSGMWWCDAAANPDDALRCPYGMPGDRLWVRETWAENLGTAGGHLYRADHGSCVAFAKADLRTGEWTHNTGRWRPSIHMPRAVSRITLDITGVRVERLGAISRGDAMAEGCPFANMAKSHDPRWWFADLWREINGAESWDANPWVWVVEFERATPSSDGRKA